MSWVPSRKSAHARLGRVASVTVTAIVLLAGCSALGPASSSVPKSSPSHYAGQLLGVDPNFGENMARCLKAAGFNVTLDADGSISMNDLPQAQHSAYQQASATCEKKFGYDKPVVQTDAQKKALYEGLVKMAECLTKQGHQITNIPSEQAYLDGAYFDPYNELYKGDPQFPYDEYQRLQQICPYP